MNDAPSHDAHRPQMLGASAAFRLALALLLGLVLVLALAIFDRQRRGQIESWQEVTAVGDRTFFVPPSDTAVPAVLSWEAGPLTVASREPVKLKDTQVRRAGRDEAAGVTIYEHAARYYVRVAPGEYLPAQK